jgi:outer membrane protein TolC
MLRTAVGAIVLPVAAQQSSSRSSASSSLPSAPSAVLAASQQTGSSQQTGTKPAGVGGPSQFGTNLTIQQEKPEAVSLGLDDAISRGVDRNLQMQLAVQTERTVRGEILSVGNNLLPNIRATAYSTAEELNLAAMGFKPSSLAAFGFPAGAIHTIVKVNVTAAQLSVDQPLFNLPDYYLYRAAQKAAAVASWNLLNVRGGTVDAVATRYLAALADQAQIANAQAFVIADQEQLRQATLSHNGGVGTNLDVLRAKVQLQTDQQTVVRDQNAFEKDKIALNRLIGLPAGQQITLTDAVPYAEFATLSLDEAKRIAYGRRKDLLGLQAQLDVETRVRKAARTERLPQIAFNGYYGVLGQTTGLYHGVFTAQGVLRIPIFEEARFRGEQEVAGAQVAALERQIEALKVTIEQQIRASMLDVQSSAQLVKVAQSNVELARQALSDTRDQFAAGVSDNLPVVQAEATLAQAESRLVSTQFQYNQSKLELARNTGVVETQYKQYLGR